MNISKPQKDKHIALKSEALALDTAVGIKPLRWITNKNYLEEWHWRPYVRESVAVHWYSADESRKITVYRAISDGLWIVAVSDQQDGKAQLVPGPEGRWTNHVKAMKAAEPYCQNSS